MKTALQGYNVHRLFTSSSEMMVAKNNARDLSIPSFSPSKKGTNILTCYFQLGSTSKHNFPTCCQGTVVGPCIRGVYIVLGESVDTAL